MISPLQPSYRAVDDPSPDQRQEGYAVRWAYTAVPTLAIWAAQKSGHDPDQNRRGGETCRLLGLALKDGPHLQR
jgi:hypothetical protein